MNRNEVITLLKEILFKNSIDSSVKLLEEYCVEKGKDMKYFDAFIRTLLLTNNINTCASTAIDFYITKHGIYRLYNKHNQLIYIY